MSIAESRRDHQKLFSACDQLLRMVDATRGRSFGANHCEELRKATHHVSMAVQYLTQILPPDEVDALIGRSASMDSAADRIAERQLATMERSRSPWANPLPQGDPASAPAPTQSLVEPPVSPPPIADAWAGMAQPTPQATRPTTLEGDNSTLSIQELVSWFSFQERHGVLRVAIPNEIITIIFEGGTLVHATSSNSPPGCRLGEILVEQDAWSAADLAAFLKRIPDGTDRQMGTILGEEQTVTRDALREALKAQVKRMLNRLFASESAKFVLREGKPKESDGLVDLNMLEYLLAEARHRPKDA